MSGHRSLSMTGHKAGMKPHSLQPSPRAWHNREWQETWSDYASHTGTSARQRIKLVAKGLAQRLKASAKDVELSGRRQVKKIGVRAALLASHTLLEIASRIERRARKIQDSE